jgi:hypothetical protein
MEHLIASGDGISEDDTARQQTVDRPVGQISELA